MVTLTNVTKKYGAFQAISGITLQFGHGTVGLLGPNGAGKTSLMKILTGLIPPTAGQVMVGDIDVVRHPALLRPHLGYLPQEFGLYKNLTAYEFLDYVAIMKLIPADQRKRQVEEALELVNLQDAAERKVGGYSGGMKQRVGIAQALLGNPSLLVVDEPTAGLDPEERIRFRNILARLSGRRTVLLSTHIVGDVEVSCRRLAVLGQGRLAYVGTPEHLREKARGKVWELEVPGSQWDEFSAQHRVVSSRAVGSGLHLRVLAQENPLGRGTTVEPTLEDGYLAVMGEEGEHQHG